MGPKIISGRYWELVQPQMPSTQRWIYQQRKTGRKKAGEKGTKATIVSLSSALDHKRKE